MSNTTALEERYQSLLEETRKLGEEIEKQKKQVESLPGILWRPEKAGDYYFLESDEYARTFNESHYVDVQIIKRQQVFKTCEEAKKADRQRIAKMKVLRRVAELNHEQGWVCDWSSASQVKHLIYSDFKSGLGAVPYYMTQYLPTDHYAAKGVWEQVIKEMEADVRLGLWG